jgi:hypothetical protein
VEVNPSLTGGSSHENLEPGFVVCDHTFGTLPDAYHPHPHVCATDGGFLSDGTFVPLPAPDEREGHQGPLRGTPNRSLRSLVLLRCCAGGCSSGWSAEKLSGRIYATACSAALKPKSLRLF